MDTLEHRLLHELSKSQHQITSLIHQFNNLIYNKRELKATLKVLDIKGYVKIFNDGLVFITGRGYDALQAQGGHY